MALTQPRALLQSTFIPNVETTLLPVEAGTVVQIDKCTVINTSGGTQNFTIKLVQSGGAATAVNTVIQGRSLLAGESSLCPEVVGQYLNAGDFLSAIASAGGALSIRISGRKTSA